MKRGAGLGVLLLLVVAALALGGRWFGGRAAGDRPGPAGPAERTKVILLREAPWAKLGEPAGPVGESREAVPAEKPAGSPPSAKLPAPREEAPAPRAVERLPGPKGPAAAAPPSGEPRRLDPAERARLLDEELEKRLAVGELLSRERVR